MANSYSSRRAADYLGISLSTLYRLDKDGLLKPFMTPGGHRRFTKSDLDRYIEKSKTVKSSLNPSQYKQAAAERRDPPPASITPNQKRRSVPPRNIIDLRRSQDPGA